MNPVTTNGMCEIIRMSTSSTFNLTQSSQRMPAMDDRHAEPNNQLLTVRSIPRQPLIPVAIFLILGILADFFFHGAGKSGQFLLLCYLHAGLCNGGARKRRLR